MVGNRRTGEYLFGMFFTINVVRTSSPRKTASTSITVGSRGTFLGGDDVGVLVLAVEARWMAGDGGVCEVKLRNPAYPIRLHFFTGRDGRSRSIPRAAWPGRHAAG